jgi:hypothetical protein
MAQLDELKRGDEVLIMIDSVGNLASKKEVEDALKQNTAADMTRAKQLKSLFRMVTPHLTLKNIPMIVVNHSYKTQEMYSKDVCLVVLVLTTLPTTSSCLVVSRRRLIRPSMDITSSLTSISRDSLKRSRRFLITVLYKGGINKWSGLLDLALLGNFITKPKIGWYQLVDQDTGELW